MEHRLSWISRLCPLADGCNAKLKMDPAQWPGPDKKIRNTICVSDFFDLFVNNCKNLIRCSEITLICQPFVSLLKIYYTVINTTSSFEIGGSNMDRSIFRKESLDRISSPEQLNDYIHVTNPGVWLIMSAVIILLTGVCVWSIFGRLDTTVSVGAVTEQNQTICYVKESDIQSVELGMPVRIDEQEYRIYDISPQPVRVDDTFAQYLLHVGALAEGEWAYAVTLDGVYGENGTIQAAEIVIESIAPMRFILN